MAFRWLVPALLLSLSPLGAQQIPRERLEEARVAWDEGRFVEALQALEALLSGPGGDGLLEEIAGLTGELYPVRELSGDGRAVRWAPGGRHAAYESGAGLEVITHVLEVSGGALREVAVVAGSGLAFSPSGREVAYLSVVERTVLEEALARLQAGVDAADRAARARLRPEMERLQALHTRITVRELSSGLEETLALPGASVQGLLYHPGDGALHFLGTVEGETGPGVFRGERQGSPRRVTPEGGAVSDPSFAGATLVYGTGRGSFAVLDLVAGRVTELQGSSPVASADGHFLAFQGEEGGEGTVSLLSLVHAGEAPGVVARTSAALSTSSARSCFSCPAMGGLALSPTGARAAFQAMPREDWEIFLAPAGAADPGEPAAPRQITREIQHDLYPVFLGEGRLLAMKGEGRHRRSHLYDLETGAITWLFRNNTVRTVAPEYEWAASPDGSKLLIVAERDGNTVSPERGVYLMELDRKVTREEVLARIRASLAAEKELRARAEAMYAPVADEIRTVVERISVPRIFRYEEALFRMGSKNVTQPGNGPAIEYLQGKLREFGYEPELQWFDARGAQSANVVARLEGTVSPDVVYAVSAHFDSNTRSPGADDNNTATVGLLEMARVLASRPLPATVEIAFFTGEESGLLGSREYVRRAVASGKRLVGALNNDMVGFAEDHRLDNTIRYSNQGIRDLQHGAALLFSRMTLYDAEYYKSTDAAAYYDAYGDIVGGIGSYPILASPHYHQTHDVLETINHELVGEVARVTTASAMLLASAPSRLGGLAANRQGSAVQVTWTPAVEADVVSYRVAWGPAEDPLRTVTEVRGPRATLQRVPGGFVVSVRAVNRRGLEGWDWARVEVAR
jgi:hypothetical protein